MAEYTAGTAKVQIRPNLKGFKRALEAELKAMDVDASVEVNPDGSRFQRELRAMVADTPDAHIDVDADTAAASEHINAAARDRHATIETDADTAGAEAQIDAAARDRKANIDADADTAGAEAQIDVAARNRHSEINLRVDKRHIIAARAALAALQGQIAAVNSQMAALAAQNGSMLLLSTGVGMIGVSAAGAIGPLSAMTGSIIATGGALAALPGLAAAAAAGIAALGIGLKGIGAAFGAMGKSAGGAGGDTGKAMKAAQRSVEDAERGIVQAQRRVADAERKVADAQKAARKAQEELNRARKEAVDDLKELNDQLRDAALDEEDAVLAVARAKQRLQEANSDSDASGLDRAEADLAYRKAIANLERTREENNKLAEEVHEANQAGVEGSEKVLNAKEKVEQSVRAEADAQQDLRDALDGVEQAQQKLADALDNLASAGAGAAGGVDAFAEAMDNLSPKAQAFVLAMQALGPAWHDLRMSVQDGLFDSLGEDITTLANNQLPGLKTGLTDIAEQLNIGLRSQIQALGSERSQLDLTSVLGNSAGMFAELNRMTGPLAQGLLDISAASAEHLPALGAGLADAGEKFAAFLTEAADTGKVDQWLASAGEAFHSIGSTLSDLGGVISGVFGAAAQAGESALTPMSTALSMLNEWANSDAGQNALVSFFTAMQDGMSAIGPALGTALESIGTTVLPFFANLMQGIGPGLNDIMGGLAAGLAALSPLAAPLGEALGAFGTAVAPALEFVGQLLTTVIGPALEPIKSLFESLTPVIEQLAADLQPAMETIGQVVGQLFEALAPLVGDILAELAPLLADIVVTLADTLAPILGVVVQVISAIAPLLPSLVAAIAEIFGALSPLLPLVAEIIVNLITPFIPVIQALLPAIVGIVDLFADLVIVIAPVIELLAKLIGVFAEVLATAIGFVATVLAQFGTLVTGAIGSIAQLVIGIVGGFADMGVATGDMIVQWVRDILQWFNNLWTNASAAFSEGIMDITHKVSDMVQGVIDKFKNLANTMPEVGKEMMRKLLDGLKSGWNSIKSWSKGAFSSLNPFKNATGSITTNATGSVMTTTNRDPQVSDGNNAILWGEAGEEAYIPLDNDYRRPRAVALTAAVAGHFGYQLVDPAGTPVNPGPTSRLAPTTRAFAEGGITTDELDEFSQGLEGQPYVFGGINWGDCSGAMSAVTRFAVGLDPFAGRFATASEGKALADMGFSPGLGAPGDLRIGYMNGGPGGGHTSGTLPNGINVEMGGARGNGQYGGNAAGADDSYYTDHMHLPGDYFKQVEVPVDTTSVLDGFNAYDDASVTPLKKLRSSTASDPDSYGTGASKLPSSWSEWAGSAAKTAVSQGVKDTLSFIGLEDDLPPLLKAVQQLRTALGSAGSGNSRASHERDIAEVEKTSAAVLEANPKAKTTTITGAAIVGLKPKDPGNERTDGDLGYSYDPAGGAEQWRDLATRALAHKGYPTSTDYVDAMVAQINTESSGNPNAVQGITDVNSGGNEAQGLLQVTPKTFNWLWDEEDGPNDPFNPWTNMNVALDWMDKGHGRNILGVWGHGHGYATGGYVTGPGGPTDDAIPARLSNGEYVIRQAAAQHALPLLQRINASPAFAAQATQALATPQQAHSSGVQVHYHIETNNLDEGMRRATLHSRQQVMAMAGA